MENRTAKTNFSFVYLRSGMETAWKQWNTSKISISICPIVASLSNNKIKKALFWSPLVCFTFQIS